MTPSASPPPSNASAGVSLRAPLIFHTDTRGRCWRLEKLAYRTPLEAREEHELSQAAAALNIQTGEVHGKTTARHTSQDFVGFLEDVVATCEPDQEIHVILDNLSAPRIRP